MSCFAGISAARHVASLAVFPARFAVATAFFPFLLAGVVRAAQTSLPGPHARESLGEALVVLLDLRVKCGVARDGRA